MNQEDTEITYVNTDELHSSSVAVKNKKNELKNINIDEIIEAVRANEGVTIEDIIKKTRVQKISDIRKAIVLLSGSYCNVSDKLLSEKLNVSPSMISKIKSGDSKGTAYVEEVIKRWKEISK